MSSAGPDDAATSSEPAADAVRGDPAVCPYPVANPVMIQRWNVLTFLHWRFPPDAVQRLLPSGLEVEVCDGAAWVGLVPFLMEVGLPHVKPVPWVSRFCETNVRTYVRDGAGRSGIWFFSLDASRLGAVVVARTTYRLPYYWAEMGVDRDGPIVRYHCRRRWPGPRGAAGDAVIEVGEPYPPEEISALEHFLTARWALFSVAGPRRRFALARHQPWPLRRARVIHIRDDLLPAAGLPRVSEPPLAHFSPGVEVSIGRPQSEPL